MLVSGVWGRGPPGGAEGRGRAPWGPRGDPSPRGGRGLHITHSRPRHTTLGTEERGTARPPLPDASGSRPQPRPRPGRPRLLWPEATWLPPPLDATMAGIALSFKYLQITLRCPPGRVLDGPVGPAGLAVRGGERPSGVYTFGRLALP